MFKSEAKVPSSLRQERTFLNQVIERPSGSLGVECRGDMVSKEAGRQAGARSCRAPEVFLKICEISQIVMRKFVCGGKK